MIPRIPFCRFLKDYQDIDIAIGMEVFAQDRTKDGEFFHLPFAAELDKTFSISTE